MGYVPDVILTPVKRYSYETVIKRYQYGTNAHCFFVPCFLFLSLLRKNPYYLNKCLLLVFHFDTISAKQENLLNLKGAICLECHWKLKPLGYFLFLFVCNTCIYKKCVFCLKTQMSKFSQDYGFKAAFLILDASFLEKGLSSSLYMLIWGSLWRIKGLCFPAIISYCSNCKFLARNKSCSKKMNVNE